MLSTETHPPRPARRVAWYGLTIFLSSAALLVLEIVAGRLIAPYVGVSLYTWTSIIGVILAGLSLGNWLGGVWADRGGTEAAAGLTLALAGTSSLAILLILTLIAPLLQDSRLDLLSLSFLYVVAMFFVPAVLLGVVTPLLTTLALRLDARAGHVVGRMHALAALGSIAGTFITGYWLLQAFGSRHIVVACGVLLFVLAAPLLRRVSPTAIGAVLLGGLAVSGAAWVRQGMASICDWESNYFCVRVIDYSQAAPRGRARAMILDHLIHGINHASEPDLLISPYVRLMDDLVTGHFGADGRSRLRWFFAGGGAYTLPRAVQAREPGATVVVSELDPLVTDAARARLFLHSDGMRIMHTDARVALGQLAPASLDVVVGDAYHDISIPYHLTTREYAALVKSRMAPGGLYVLNVLDAFPDPRLVKAMVKTLRAEFRHVDVWVDRLPNVAVRTTFVISATDRGELPELLRSEQGDVWLRVTEPLEFTGTPYQRLPVLTDDFVPVESLISEFYFSALGR